MHSISHKDISGQALKVLHELQKKGFDAYLVGGCIRDLLLGRSPKDFDVTTNATPDQVAQVFNNCRQIGRRFKIVHVIFARDFIEVATFRGASSDTNVQASPNGFLVSDNSYSKSISDDAVRRDFTINCIYWNSLTGDLLCHKDAIEDIKNKVVRIIGDPVVRYKEDPVRIIRAIRFSTKLGMKIEDRTKAPIKDLGYLLKSVHSARIYDEVSKLFFFGNAVINFKMLKSYGLLPYLLSDVFTFKLHNKNMQNLVNNLLVSADGIYSKGNRVSHSYFYSALFWFPVMNSLKAFKAENPKINQYQALRIVVDQWFKDLSVAIIFRKRLIFIIFSIYHLQLRIADSKKYKYPSIVNSEFFDKAIVLLDIRVAANDSVAIASKKKWGDFHKLSPKAQKQVINQAKNKKIRKFTKKKI